MTAFVRSCLLVFHPNGSTEIDPEAGLKHAVLLRWPLSRVQCACIDNLLLKRKPLVW
ncbi:hypothetical protein Plhal304r1_c056g0142401 [Plasmopara halstedii]